MEDTKEREEDAFEEKMDDKEEQKWSGMIPISISMRPEEVCSIDHPEPYFVLVPRFARLTAFHGWFENGDIGRYFQQFRLMSDSSSSSSQASASASVLMNTAENTKSGGGGGGGDDDDASNENGESDDTAVNATEKKSRKKSSSLHDAWFETKPLDVDVYDSRRGLMRKKKLSIPIRWNVPFGVVADILRALTTTTTSPRLLLPLELVARYSQRDELGLSFRHAVGEDAQKACKSHFFNALKEASFIQTGSSQVVMSLGVQARDDLWESTMTKGTMGVGDESVHGNERSGYEKAKEALTKIHKEARKREKKMNAGGGGAVPIRAYEVDVMRQGAGDDDDGDDIDDGQGFWERCVRFSSAPVARNLSIAECLDDVMFPDDDTNSREERGRRVKIEGIEIDEAKPVGVLWNALSAPDGFMHIVVIKNRNITK